MAERDIRAGVGEPVPRQMSPSERESADTADPFSAQRAMNLAGVGSKPPPWRSANKDALPTYERATNGLVANANTLGQSAVKLVDRVRGRKWVTLYVPLASGAGIYWAHDASTVESGFGFIMDIGMVPLKIDTEAEIWAMSGDAVLEATVCVANGFNKDDD